MYETNDNYMPRVIERQKNIALIAHDFKKAELVDWCRKNKEILEGHFLVGTGTTARIIADMAPAACSSRENSSSDNSLPA